MTEPSRFHNGERRKLSLLRTLARLNSEGILPRMSELVRIDDGRPDIPQNTLVTRRRYIRALLTRGFFEWVNDLGNNPVRLAVTPEGLAAMAAYEKQYGTEV